MSRILAVAGSMFTGLAAGLAVQIRWFETGTRLEVRSASEVARRLALGGLGGALVALALALALGTLLRLRFSREGAWRFLAAHWFANLAPVAYGLYWTLYEKTWLVAVPVGAAWLVGQLVALLLLVDDARRDRLLATRGWLAFLFFLSGLAALVYQVTWQRALFTSFGINIESVTVVVTLFMLGLGLGSLLGGYLSRRAPERLPAVFLACEVAIGLFGLASLPLIRGASALLAGSGLAVTTIAVFLLLLPPTLMMGATLPVLVDYLHAAWNHVGRSVGLLYFINTLGSAAACFIAADLLFPLGGLQVAVVFAAACNLCVGVLVFHYMRRVARLGGSS